MPAVPPDRADLHNHTTHSDGSFSPTELVTRAHELGLAALGITDHDTIDALEEGLVAAAAVGLELVCGVEVTLRFVEPFFRGSLHLLLYFDPALLRQPAFVAEARQTLALGRGRALNLSRLEAINAHFGPHGEDPRLPRELTEDDLLRQGDGRISRRHFALALNALGIAERAAVSAIIGNDSPAYVPSGMDPAALEPLLRRYPLVRVLAHPAAGSYPGDSLYKEVLPPWETVLRLMPTFLALGLDGLEVSYPGHTDELRALVDAERRRLGLPLATGGSDCHDATGRPLGSATVPRTVVDQLRRRMAWRAEKLANA